MGKMRRAVDFVRPGKSTNCSAFNSLRLVMITIACDMPKKLNDGNLIMYETSNLLHLQ